jgi:hypothetical protein
MALRRYNGRTGAFIGTLVLENGAPAGTEPRKLMGQSGSSPGPARALYLIAFQEGRLQATITYWTDGFMFQPRYREPHEKQGSYPGVTDRQIHGAAGPS